MPGSTTGTYIHLVTFGESHGRAIGAVLDGVRPGLPIDVEYIQHELDRRRPGQSAVTTPRAELDRVEIISGVFEGKSTGTPICLIIWNTDQRPGAYEKIKTLFRPGHAGYTYLAKYGISDYRGGGRSSGRETAARVAAGAVARQLLRKRNIGIVAYTTEAGGIRAELFDEKEIERNPLRCPDPIAAKAMEERIIAVKNEGDSVGGIVEVRVSNVPVGLGEPVFDKLEADLGKALLSIGAVKGFEVGNGFAAARLRASENNDPMYVEEKTGRVRTRSNNAGGIAGGISNGEDIVVRIAVKPPSSIRKEQETVSVNGKAATISVEGRHDPCLCPRIVPVAEAMVALVIFDHLTRLQLMKKTNRLHDLRDSIDQIDHSIMLMLAERQIVAGQIGEVKKRSGRKVSDAKREEEVLRKRSAFAKELGLDPGLTKEMFRKVFHLSKAKQKNYFGKARS